MFFPQEKIASYNKNVPCHLSITLLLKLDIKIERGCKIVTFIRTGISIIYYPY
jgi:hypothetical protein